VLTDASGVPLGVAVAGANRHDVMLLAATLASIVVRRPRPTARTPQGVCLDKAYDITWVYRLLSDAGFTPHVRAIREDVTGAPAGHPGAALGRGAHTQLAQPLPRAARPLG
jgi:hypothetical protein